MARVFEETGFPRHAAAAVAAADLRRGDAALRLRPARHALRPGARDLGDALAGTEFKVFAGVLAAGGVVRGLNAGAREVPRSELDALTEHVKRYGAGGLVWAFVQEDGSVALADGEVPLRRAARGGHARARRHARATCC